jgi:FkbM family methyltransferase
MKKGIQKIVRYLGFEVRRYSIDTSDRALMKRCMDYLSIDLLIDIGANLGQYATACRDAGYKGQIISLEPLKSVFIDLKKLADRDGKWYAFNYGAGKLNDELIINVSDNRASSSLFDVTKLSTDAAPESGFVGKEKISVVSLDSFLLEKIEAYRNPYLKIDVQGYELEVLEGAKELLHRVKGVQLEMSFVPLYDQGPLYKEVIAFMEAQNFELYSILPDFRNRTTGKMLQADGIFINKSLI